MKTVLHIITSFNRGGRERQLAIICKHSIETCNLILSFEHSKFGYLDEYKIMEQYYCIETDHWITRVRYTFDLCKKKGIDILVVWGPVEATIGWVVSLIWKAKVVNMSIRHGITNRKLYQRFRTMVLKLSKYVVANSRAGLVANNVIHGFVLYNGVENIPSIEEVNLRLLKRQSVLFTQSKTIFVSVANLVPYKDYYTVLKALSSLHANGIYFHYYIIGEGSERASIEKTIQSYGLEGCVTLTGRVQNVDDYLMGADVMIHSSLGEGCSNAILEGMKHGLPIIATNVGGTPEIVDSSNAILFEYGNAEELTQQIKKLLCDNELMVKMSKASNKITHTRFSVEIMIKRWDNYINSIN